MLQEPPVKKSKGVLFYVAASLVVLLAILATGAILFVTKKGTLETSSSSTTATTITTSTTSTTSISRSMS